MKAEVDPVGPVLPIVTLVVSMAAQLEMLRVDAQAICTAVAHDIITEAGRFDLYQDL